MTPYASLDYAEDYFENIVNADEFTDAPAELQLRYLNNATLLIDTLGYIGAPLPDNETGREFPRNIHNGEIPDAIKQACCDIALALAIGIDPNEAALSGHVLKETYAKASITYSGKVPDYLQYGIPSLAAWLKLKPYLNYAQTVKLLKS